MNKKISRRGKYLLAKYAHKLVQGIAEIIGYEVLMTNREGIIIGSSDPERLGKPLVEAPVVIRTRKGYLIDEAEAKRVDNAVIGVTFPIEDMSGEVIGSIAITGNPEDVKPFALIVKKHAELFLKERVSLSSIFEKERNLQNFIRELKVFDPGESDITLMETKARYFGYRPEARYSVIWIRISNFLLTVEELSKRSNEKNTDSELMLQSLRNRVILDIRDVFCRTGDICAPFAEDDFIILHALTEDERTWSELKNKCSQTLERLSSSGLKAVAAIGNIAYDLETLSTSFIYAGEVLEKGRSFDPEGRIFSIEDLRFEILLSSVKPEYRYNFLSLKLDSLKKQRNWPEIRETILGWCNSSFSIKEASEKLHVHRNTLKYRLEKIESICSIDLRDFRSILELYTAIILDFEMS